MAKSQFYAAILSALTLIALAWGPAHAAQFGCSSPLASNTLLTSTNAEAGFPLEIARDARIEVADAKMQLSQTRLRGGSVRLPNRVPAGQTFAIQMENQRSYNRFSAGSALPQTDCVQINCPSTFEPGTVCWKCVESLTQ